MSAEKTRPPGERRERKRASAERGEGRAGGRRRAKKGCAVGAVGTLRRKMDSIFHEHRSKHGLREGREGESRAQVEKQYRRLPTNFTNQWRAKRRRASFCWL